MNAALSQRSAKVNSLRAFAEAYRDKGEELREAFAQLEVHALRTADVVGLTTTGAAKHLATLVALGAKVVLCEEAGEVLEAHVLAALSPATERLILIGDHLQLRPKIERHELTCDAGQGFRLDLSLFERLILDTKHPHSTLAQQWRMRPEIADLARCTLYPQLEDAAVVKGWPSARGIEQNVFFFDHTFPEDRGDGPAESHRNTKECEMAVKLVLYLQQQGYEQRQITLLTPYLGQLGLLRNGTPIRPPICSALSSDSMQLSLASAWKCASTSATKRVSRPWRARATRRGRQPRSAHSKSACDSLRSITSKVRGAASTALTLLRRGERHYRRLTCAL